MEKSKRNPAFITSEAHKKLPKLTMLLTQKKGVRINYTNATSIAIIELTERLERQAERRAQREQASP